MKDVFINKYAVYSYDDLSLQELLTRFYNEIQDCKDGYITVKEFYDYLIKEGLSIEVANQLTKWVEDGTLNKIINENVFNELSTQLNNIAYIMPPPSDVATNTRNLQTLLDKYKEGKNITIRFLDGEYELNSCFIGDNTTLELSKNTVLVHKTSKKLNPLTNGMVTLNSLFYNAIPFDDEDSLIRGYNGRSNITIKGGTVYPYCFFTMIHGKNITIDGVEIRDIQADHSLQISSCNNVTVKNCNFKGMRKASTGREYVEYIQVDWCTSKAVPGWSEGSPIYDNGVNDGITITNCKFEPSVGTDYSYMYTAIGSHSSDGDNLNKNIVISNCEFKNFSYVGLTLTFMDNVLCENNVFYSSELADSIHIKNSSNVVVRNNKVTGTKRLVFCTNSNNSTIDNNNITANIVGTSDCLLVGESNNIIVNNNKFNNCQVTQAVMQVRSSTNTTVTNNIENNTSSTLDSFVHAYVKSEVPCDKLVIKNNQTNKNVLYSTKGLTNVICDGIQEELFKGEITLTNEPITLNDTLKNFTNLHLELSSYGSITLPLNFYNNRALIRYFNIPDDSLENVPQVSLYEVDLTKTDDTTLVINRISHVKATENGFHYADSNLILKKITGERIKY